MATCYAYIVVECERPANAIKNRFFPANKMNARSNADNVSNLINAVASGTVPGTVYAALSDDASVTKAAGTIVVGDYTAATGNFVRFGFAGYQITLTEGTDFTAETSNTVTADNIVTAIEAHTILSGIMTASNAAGTITLTSRVGGKMMHQCAITTDDAIAFTTTDNFGVTASGDSGTLAEVFPRKMSR